MREIHSQKESVTANSPPPKPTQTPPKHQSSSIANSQPIHDQADPTTVVEPTDLLPNNPVKSRSGEPSTKKSFVNKRRSFSVLHRGVSDPYRPPAPAPLTPAERGSGLPPLPSLNYEETAAPDSVKLRRMIERFEKMKVLPPRDDLRAGNSEEAVTVEGAEKSESITFNCPCGKGYEVLFSDNKWYYKCSNTL